jgi:hypothetical protein
VLRAALPPHLVSVIPNGGCGVAWGWVRSGDGADEEVGIHLSAGVVIGPCPGVVCRMAVACPPAAANVASPMFLLPFRWPRATVDAVHH